MPRDYEYINSTALDSTEINQAPFPHAVIKNFIRPDKLEGICRDFPNLDAGGIFNCNEGNTTGELAQFIQELKGGPLQQWLSTQFGLDLHELPTMTTLRGHSRKKDGRVHTDSKDKIITVLIYLNPTWNADTGKLRLLRSNNIEDVYEEVTPSAGTCVIFKVTDNCWHGYKSFVGSRRSIMFNYLVSQQAAKRHKSNHWLSAKLKKLKKSLSTT